MYLIDWEYAGMNTIYYEIADILVPGNMEIKMLKIYFEDKNMVNNIYLIDMFKPFPDIYWFLWSMIQLNISSIDFDYYNYGKVKYENAKKNIIHLRSDYGVKI